ncbi:11512_t:CDS:1, partial [Gigaspora margarita]
TSNNNKWEPVKVIEAEGPMESNGKYLADLYKAASNASANTAKVIQYKIKSWYNYANKFENRVKKLIKTGVREKVARIAVYEEIEPFLLVSSKINLHQKTYKARNILYLFSNIGVDKIQRIRTYSANNIASYDADKLELIIDYVKNIVN